MPPRDSWPGGGEVAIGISFVHGVIDQVLKGFPLNYGAPSDGTGYEIGGLSLGTIAIRFIHWALTPDAQRLAAERGESYQIQSNSKTPIPKVAPRFEDFHVIKYDNLKYGDAKVRDALIGRSSIV